MGSVLSTLTTTILGFAILVGAAFLLLGLEVRANPPTFVRKFLGLNPDTHEEAVAENEKKMVDTWCTDDRLTKAGKNKPSAPPPDTKDTTSTGAAATPPA